MVSRRKFLTTTGAAAAAAILPARDVLASRTAGESLILDPETREWVRYSQRRAYRYYKKNGQVPEEFRPRDVPFRTAEEPGTIIVDGNKHFLYFVQPGFRARRYGIGVGKEGFGWAGIVRIGRKAEWPTWTPPAEMIERRPDLAKYAGGMPGGPDNPLGARSLYLYENGRDTIYRIHGTTEPWAIGLNTSSGCIRMINEDIIDLYTRASVGAKVIVLMQGAALFRGV
ncbi:MAG: L,D-transpeptidase [Pseudomonadota bacterium]